jgi:hypothetical protein
MKEELTALSDQELSQLVLGSQGTLGTICSPPAILAQRLRKFRELYEAIPEKPAGAALLYRENEQSDVKAHLIGENIIVGRLSRSRRHPSASDLALVDPEMSRIHFEISCADEFCLLRDLGSRNGTLLNGERLPPGPSALKAGDMISAGQTIFMFTGS